MGRCRVMLIGRMAVCRAHCAPGSNEGGWTMKRGMLCMSLLLSGCLLPEVPTGSRFDLTWTCRSAEGCEHAEELERIDRMDLVYKGRLCHFTTTQDESFVATGTQIFSDLLPPGCSWLHFLTLFGHELERSRLCFVPGGFELELSIPNEDPTTSSMWLVKGRDLEDLY
jgi:hypothetical protein